MIKDRRMGVQANTMERDCIGLIVVRCALSLTLGALFVTVMLWGQI